MKGVDNPARSPIVPDSVSTEPVFPSKSNNFAATRGGVERGDAAVFLTAVDIIGVVDAD